MIQHKCNRCGKILPAGKKCTCTTEYKKNYNRFGRDNKIKKFRSSPEWLRARSAVIDRDDGIDQYIYNTTGEILPGCSVHHIVPLSEDYTKRLDMNNLITLSEDTHGRIEYLYKTKQKKELQNELLRIVQNINGGERHGC